MRVFGQAARGGVGGKVFCGGLVPMDVTVTTVWNPKRL